MANKSWSSNEMAAVAGLVAAWDALVAEGGMDEAELAETLVEQLDGSTQGWDGSMEDAEEHPELAALVGLDLEDPDEQEDAWEAWGRVVAEAARQWLAKHPDDEWMAREAAGDDAPTPATCEACMAAAMEWAEAGIDPATQPAACPHCPLG